MARDILFKEGSLDSLLFGYEKQLPQEINDLEGNRVLSSSFTDLCAHFEERFRLDIPTLRVDDAHALPPEDTKIQLSPHESQFFYDEPGPVHVPGTVFSLVVPFDGDPDMFKYLPNSFVMRHIEGRVTGDGQLLLRHPGRDHDAAATKAEFDDRLKMIQQYLQTQRQQVAGWNAKLPERVRTLLEQRKQKALSALNVAESLGYPLKRRDAPTYDIPVTRKRLAVQTPTAKGVPYTPEPALAMQQYDQILKMIGDAAIMMERSPSAFATMGEEHLRDHLLVILNAQFEGQATGETFNKGGKTDILIREKNRNVFIAECKFWDGSKTLTDAIDQLLSYACWRDTKLAVIVFNRRKNFSAVLATIPETVKAHPQCKHQLDYKSESGFRFLLKQKDDPDREMTLTVLAFHVPGAADGSNAAAIEPKVMPAPTTPARRRRSRDVGAAEPLGRGPGTRRADRPKEKRASCQSRRLAPALQKEAATAHELGPRRKFAHRRGASLKA